MIERKGNTIIGEYVVALDDEVPFLSNELKSIRGET